MLTGTFTDIQVKAIKMDSEQHTNRMMSMTLYNILCLSM